MDCNNICQNDFARLEQHVKNMHPKSSDLNNYPCKICNERFNNETRLRKHVTNHIGPFKCEHCGSILKNKFCLWQHIKNQHKGRELKACEVCGKEVKSIKRHMDRNHSEKDKLKQTCKLCDKEYYNLGQHIKQEHKPKKS